MNKFTEAGAIFDPRMHCGLVLGGLVSVLLTAGCGGQPQVGAENLRTIESLRTAASAKRSDWLEENAKLIDQRHAAGEMTDEQFQAFDSIIKLARDGRWSDAESQALALAKAQRPAGAGAQKKPSKPPPTPRPSA